MFVVVWSVPNLGEKHQWHWYHYCYVCWCITFNTCYYIQWNMWYIAFNTCYYIQWNMWYITFNTCYHTCDHRFHYITLWVGIVALLVVRVMSWMARLYCYDFLVNEGIGLILVIHIFHRYCPSVLCCFINVYPISFYHVWSYTCPLLY